MIEYFNSVTFANKEALWLLLLPLFYLLYYFLKYRRQFPEFTLSTIAGIRQGGKSIRGRLKPLPAILRALAFAFISLAVARPQSQLKEEKITTEGIDIVIAMDVSSSMLARDFEPNRLEAAKKVAGNFIDQRPGDRIGLVVFAGESFTQCPVTTDKIILKQQLAAIRDGLIEDGTAIGMGLATAINRLKETDAKSKVIILLTDGVNNTGFIDPLTAAEIAAQLGIRVYTIGVGTRGTAPYPFKMGNRVIFQNVPVEIDEELLQKISAMTNGKYFRATDNRTLEAIFEEIDKLEKSKIEVTAIRRLTEEFYPLAFIALTLLSVDTLLRYTLLRSIP